LFACLDRLVAFIARQVGKKGARAKIVEGRG
jgi:hypothetical protein